MTPSEFLNSKKLLPTEMRTKQLRLLPLWVKEQAFFMAGVSNAVLLGAFREAAQAVVDGRLSEQEATRGIREALAATNYQAGDGQEGTIKDLSTVRRQLVSIRTAVALAQGWGKEAKQQEARAVFPAKELYRAGASRVPRLWAKLWAEGSAARNAARADLLPLRPDMMMAPLGDPVWVLLSDFGAPYDPLKYGSNMRQRPVGRRAAVAAGIVSENGNAARNDKAGTPKPEGSPKEAASRNDETKTPKPEGQDGNETDFATKTEGASIRSPGEGLEVEPGIPEGAKGAVETALKGLGKWDGEKLIFTDPNGTRPAGPEELAPLIVRQNVDGTDNYQRAALEEWRALGGDEEALAEMRKRHAGEDVLDDFNRLVERMQRARPGVRVVDLLAGLAGLIAGLMG